jgi:hypothetical protein
VSGGKALASRAQDDSEQRSGGFDRVDAINKLFAEFQFAYHNQFHKAFPDAESLVIAKKYWLSSLEEFPPPIIVAAGKKVIATQEYLPSISVMLRACGDGKELLGLPETRAAYAEACAAPSPKRDYSWSHEAVYFAGLASGWFLLKSEPEPIALPVFRNHYERLCQQVLRGESLVIDPIPALPEKTSTPLSGDELHSRLARLKQTLAD